MRTYVDLDDTLINAVHGAGRGIGKRTLVGVGAGDFYHSLIRPKAGELLSSLREMGEVYMLTTATRAYACAHNDIFQLGFSDDQIVAREDYVTRITLAYSSAWVATAERVCPDARLIDNLPIGADAARLKMSYLGIKKDRYIQIREFYGKDPEIFNDELAHILRSIRDEEGLRALGRGGAGPISVPKTVGGTEY